ncbi:probable glycosyltransferase At5g03795 [Prosopis cineraria]|uniref:probable glycosyltransferase At5g03795 n=1 Tax=Prosopis cineraria TaxID=364024 RepID=UPI00240FD2DC|nr:probable glycosyltransferase At5g03795 [Prosopis cineraria]
MGQDCLSSIKLETKKLLWLISFTFALILAFQYFELPYGNVLLNVFHSSKIPESGASPDQTAQPPSNSEISDKMTSLIKPNSTNGDALEMANNTSTFEEQKTATNFGFVLKPQVESNRSSILNESYKVPGEDNIKKSDNGSAKKQAGRFDRIIYNFTMGSNNLTHSSREENAPSRSPQNTRSSYTNTLSLPPAMQPKHPIVVDPNNTTSGLSIDSKSNISSVQKENIAKQDGVLKPLQNDDNAQGKSSSISNKDSHKLIPEVTSISEMKKLLLQSHASYRSMRPLWSSAVDQELLQARSEIENAPIVKDDPSLYAPLYHNFSLFKRSYELMEETLKVHVYGEGARPVLHSPFLTGIYASEGWFMKVMEANKRFVTEDPKKAHLFYLPFSSRMLEEALYVKNSHSHKNLIEYLNNYVDTIGGKYPFWNRTRGADHFLVACHDWAPAETREGMSNCIKALCNADVKEGFVFGKDVSLPETFVINSRNPTKDLGGFRVSRRPNLAFFAGSMHGYVRPILLKYWENKDADMKIFGKLPKSRGNRDYIHYMKSSKYCICAKGYEVNSPRVVEAIFYECVPVIISDNFVPPFFEVLNWESFAVFVLEKDIPNLKSILLSIPIKTYLRMQMRVKKVQQHFLWHANPVKYDIFHMTLHSVWYNRVFSITAA